MGGWEFWKYAHDEVPLGVYLMVAARVRRFSHWRLPDPDQHQDAGGKSSMSRRIPQLLFQSLLVKIPDEPVIAGFFKFCRAPSA